jgi:MFS family permease
VIPRSAALYLAAVQFFFAVTWTLYIIYLPSLAGRAGIGPEWIPWILVADQVVFAVMDVLTGFWVDKVRAGFARLGGWIVAITAISCASFVLLPYAGANATLLLALVFIWAITSSALRSPPWALLSRYAAAPTAPMLSAIVLTGTAVAAALAPYLGVALRDVDPRLPFIISTLTLIATVSGLAWVERRLAAGSPTPAGDVEPPYDFSSPRAKFLLGAFFVGLLVMAAGYQVHFSLNSARAYLEFAGKEDLQYLMPVFWIGFNLLMFPAAGFVRRYGALEVMAVSGIAGALATLAAAGAGSLNTLIAAQFIAGGFWGAMSVGAFSAVMQFGRTRREGKMLGTLFAVLALAAFVRIGAYASDIVTLDWFKASAGWIPAAAFGGAGLLMLGALLVARPAKAAPKGAT